MKHEIVLFKDGNMTVTSLELVEQLNIFRRELEGKAELRHDNLLAVIRDEFEDEIGEGKISVSSGKEEVNVLKIQVVNYPLKSCYKDKKGEKRPMFILTTSQAKQVLLRESKHVRKAVIAYIDKLENYIKFRLSDKEHQKIHAAKLHEGLREPTQKEHIKANTIANKATSNLFGYPKMLKKGDMSPEMLNKRQIIFDEAVRLMIFKEEYNLDFSISAKIYEKYNIAEVA